MGKNTVHIKLNNAALKRLDKAAVRALDITMDQLKTDIKMQQIVPKKTGALEDSVEIKGSDDSKRTLTYNEPYARRLYFHPEYNFKQSVNQNAQGEWLEDYIDKSGEGHKYIVDVFKKVYKKEVKY